MKITATYVGEPTYWTACDNHFTITWIPQRHL